MKTTRFHVNALLIVGGLLAVQVLILILYREAITHMLEESCNANLVLIFAPTITAGAAARKFADTGNGSEENDDDV